MRTTSAAALSQNLAAELEQIKADGEPLTVLDADGKPQYVVSLAHNDDLDETDYLMSSEANRKALEESLQQYREGKLVDAPWPE